jgi:hypothetical protein
MLSLPEPSSSSGQDKGKGAKIRPGITGKDLKLAEKIEALYK